MGNTFYYIYIEKIGGRMKDCPHSSQLRDKTYWCWLCDYHRKYWNKPCVGTSCEWFQWHKNFKANGVIR